MAFTKIQLKQLQFLYKKFHAATDPEDRRALLLKITEVKTGKKSGSLYKKDRLTWKRELSKEDEQKKKQGIDAHSFMLERLRSGKKNGD